jgi:hypothetical protein
LEAKVLSAMVRISAKAKRVTLQRYLLSKIVYATEEFDLQDLCCLFENQIWLESKVSKDPDFSSNFGRDFETLSILLKEVNFQTKFTDRALLRFRGRLKDNLEALILPKRNYKDTERLYKGLFQLLPSSPAGKLLKLLPEKSRIGIGYRDKGSARDPAYDGSPSWQEVAVHRGPLYHKGRRENVKASPTNSSGIKYVTIRSPG